MSASTVEAIQRYLAAGTEILRDGTAYGPDRLPFRHYYRSLFDGDRGALEATVRNLEFGLQHIPRGTMIDIGCGHGLQAYVFALNGYQVIGVDHQPGRIECAERLAYHLGMKIDYACAEASDVLINARIRGAWMHRVIHHIVPLSPLLASLRSALEPGGAVVITTQRARPGKRERVTKRPFYTVDELRHVLGEHGLRVEHVAHHGYLTGLPARLRPPGTAHIDAFLSRTPRLRALGGSFSVAASC